MLDPQSIIITLLAKIGGGGIFNIDTVFVVRIKGSNHSIMGCEWVSHAVPSIVQAGFRESSEYWAYHMIGQDREKHVGRGAGAFHLAVLGKSDAFMRSTKAPKTPKGVTLTGHVSHLRPDESPPGPWCSLRICDNSALSPDPISWLGMNSQWW